MLLVPFRKVLFNQSGLATAVLVGGALVGAFFGGFLLKGKSGWCSSICPLLPVQRVYGRTPYYTVPNSHCQPCVGCTKNCYDFNPGVAYMADMVDDDPYYVKYRKFFAAIFPGFVLAFYTTPAGASAVEVYLRFTLFILLSLGTFQVFDAFIKISDNTLTAIYGGLAFNFYYWFTAPLFLATLGNLFGLTLPVWLTWLFRATVLLLTLIWIGRTIRRERSFLLQLTAASTVKVGSQRAIKRHRAAQADHVEVTIIPEGNTILAEPGRPLLEICEHQNLPIEAGCRMGVCGADPIAIVSGMDNLSEIGDDEQMTLERLNYAGNTRLACMARVHGPVQMSLTPEAAGSHEHVVAEGTYDVSVKHVVIIGNGIAGITAADYVRRHHPECAIDVVGQESHVLYNRMGISRLIYGRSAMQGLYLLPENWYEDHNVTGWLNTQVAHIDGETQEVMLATGDRLPYDRLILAMGSRSFVPPILGFSLSGTFVLREADDAMKIRAFAQTHRGKNAVIAGGGLLGLEAAYALHKLGLHVTVLERGPTPMRRQLDARGGRILQEYLERLGMEILVQAETEAIMGDGRVEEVTLKDGRVLPCDMFLMCVGIRSNIELAQVIGAKVNRGIVVDDGMQTNLPGVFASGDVAEHRGIVYGLWPVAVEQGKIAAINAVSHPDLHKTYQGIIPVTMLKVVGVELTSIGRIVPESDEEIVIALQDVREHRYRKLIIAEGKIVGAILFGYPLFAPVITDAVKKGRDVASYISALNDGDWDVLKE